MEWSAKTSVGLVRTGNEDAWDVRKIPSDDGELWFALVADGLGGHEGGEIASELAIKYCSKYLLDNISKQKPTEVLKSAIFLGNTRVFEAGSTKEGCMGMGTTITLALMDESKKSLYIGHVGDSRAYVISGGKIAQITEDHSVTGELIRNGSISEQEAMVHPGRNVLTMALGTQNSINVSLYEKTLLPGDIVILCTDGLTSLVDSQEILDTVTNTARADSAQVLVDLANSRGGHDNTTVIVLWPSVSFGGTAERRGETV